MKVSKRIVLITLSSLVLVILVGVFFFVFNPLGLGPEPDTVLPGSFFTMPAGDLSELEL